ncbi:MAG: hypothetical protein ABIG44_14655 [Planctomycetota bacterium]
MDRLRHTGDFGVGRIDPTAKYEVVWSNYDRRTSAIILLLTLAKPHVGIQRAILYHEVQSRADGRLDYHVGRLELAGAVTTNHYVLLRTDKLHGLLEPFYAIQPAEHR